MVDFHNHTFFCDHADGTPDEYLDVAISRDIKIFGFSDHAPLPDGLKEGITMDRDEAEDYIEMILSIKEKYKGSIDVKLGFEVDFPLYDSFERRYLEDDRIDFLIGSCHYLDDWAMDHPDHVDGYEKRGVDKVYARYYEGILSLAESGLFNIVGHFDLVKKFGHRAERDFSAEIEKIGEALKKSDMAFEVNTSGLRKPVKEVYPSFDILKIFARIGVPVTIGSDSHSPNEVGISTPYALDLLREAGFKSVSYFDKRKRFELNI